MGGGRAGAVISRGSRPQEHGWHLALLAQEVWRAGLPSGHRPGGRGPGVGIHRDEQRPGPWPPDSTVAGGGQLCLLLFPFGLPQLVVGLLLKSSPSWLCCAWDCFLFHLPRDTRENNSHNCAFKTPSLLIYKAPSTRALSGPPLGPRRPRSYHSHFTDEKKSRCMKGK